VPGCLNLEVRAPGSPNDGGAYMSDGAHSVPRLAGSQRVIYAGFGLREAQGASNPAGTTGCERAESHQLLVLLVPKTKREGLQTRD
jgi:hypothetical protein